MEEREPPPNTFPADPSSDQQLVPHAAEPPFRPGTFVVQVPKDQIYRVPPPENALIAERHRNNFQRSKSKRCCSRLMCCCLLSIVILLLLIGLAALLFFLYLKPKDPSFNVENVVVKNPGPNAKNSPNEFRIMLKVENPNKKASILYKQGGVASLSFRQNEIGSGKYPTFYLEHKDSKEVSIALESKKSVLPKEIEKSMNSDDTKVHVSLLLKMNLPVTMKTWIFSSGNTKIVVSCNLMLDTLAKGTKILSQNCETKRQT